MFIFDKLDDVVNKYNNTYQRAIKMKPSDGKPSIYTDFNIIIINFLFFVEKFTKYK